MDEITALAMAYVLDEKTDKEVAAILAAMPNPENAMKIFLQKVFNFSAKRS